MLLYSIGPQAAEPMWSCSETDRISPSRLSQTPREGSRPRITVFIYPGTPTDIPHESKVTVDTPQHSERVPIILKIDGHPPIEVKKMKPAIAPRSLGHPELAMAETAGRIVWPAFEGGREGGRPN